ncbi:MAG: hypothetical protein ACJ748_10540 [Flavisolibacter sp.]
MKYQTLLPMIAFLLITFISTAQNLEGNWKGTSLCQIKNSPCHDEKVIYHISKKKENNSYQIIASKIVEGKEIDMGTLIFSFDAEKQILYLNNNVQQINWKFKVIGNQMHGTLISNGKLFRIIDLKRED